METTLDLRPHTIEKLQELIASNMDSCEVLTEAASAMDDLSLQALFTGLVSARVNYAKELQGYVRLNGEEAKDSGTVGGAVRTQWVNLRAAINRRDPKVVLIEAERAEDAIKAAYEDVLKETAGSPLNAVLTTQYAAVKAGHDRVRAARDSYVAK
jgi:uncharacterized protein (TIGR02284 family)